MCPGHTWSHDNGAQEVVPLTQNVTQEMSHLHGALLIVPLTRSLTQWVVPLTRSLTQEVVPLTRSLTQWRKLISFMICGIYSCFIQRL